MGGECALITGVTGQDGCYLDERLVEKGHTVVGMVWRSRKDNFGRIEDLLPRFVINHG